MSHLRTQIRNEITALVTGLASTGSRVFTSRMLPQDQLPCLLVQTNDEDVSGGAVGALQDRVLTLVIRGYAKASTALDDTLDQIALEVETALAGHATASLDRVEIDFDDSLEKPVGVVTLNYRIPYFTRAGSPGVSA